MAGFLAPIIAAAGAVAVKNAIVSLGFGIVVFTGFQALKDTMASAIDTAIGGIPSDIYALLALGGFIDAIGIWLGAFTTVLTLAVTKRMRIL